MVNLDGSTGEGGGQMLRTALLWSVITRTPFRMIRIRENRDKPGLKPQHLHVLKALEALGPVRAEGARPGARELTFHPAPLSPADAVVDVGTAGSLTLLLQTLLPALLAGAGGGRFRLIGGTDVPWSPPIDYVRHVALGPALKRARELRLDVPKRGFFPAGGGEVLLEASGWSAPQPMDWTERGRLLRIRVLSAASRALADRKVAERLATAAASTLRRYGVQVLEEAGYAESRSPGCVITCVAEFEGGQKVGADALGRRGVPAEAVGQQAADQLSKEIDSGAPVDVHAADQLVPWLAMCGGAYRASAISEHTRSNVWVTEQFLGRILELEGDVIRCRAPIAVSLRS